MENYEKKYKEALERARIWKEKRGMPKDKQGILDDIFPELKKSEDELIREELINFLEVCEDTRLVANRKREKWISWLMNTKPKFKIGDWVVFNTDSTYQVEKIENYEYTLRHTLGGSMPLPFCSKNLIRLWTIQDAKDGDVLVNESRTFIYKEYDDSSIGYYASFYPRGRNKLLFEGAFFITPDIIKDIYPATKEQRSILFEKMEEAGYKWIASEKRLMKLPWGKS